MVPAQLLADAGTPVIHGRITDKDGGYTDYYTTLQVNDIPPTATLVAPSSVNEGSAFTVALVNPSDPIPADTAAGFHYAFAVDGASLAGATYANSSSNPAHSFTLDDGPSQHTITERIFDKNGGYTDYTAMITVNNVAPTATLVAPSSVNEGSSFAVALVNSSDPSQADTAAGFHYAFAVDGASLASATYANSGTSASQTFTFDDGPSQHTITERIFDKDGGYTDYTATITVNSVPPTAVFSNNGPVNEGSTVTVSFTNSFDPSPAETQAGFHYSFALSQAGLASSYAAAGTSSTQVFTALDGPATVIVYGRIFDKDNGYTEYTTTVQVNNVAPTVTPPAAQNALLGIASAFQLGSFSDPGLYDSPWTVNVELGGWQCRH